MRKIISLFAVVIIYALGALGINNKTINEQLNSDGINVVQVEMEGKTFNFLYDTIGDENVIDSESLYNKQGPMLNKLSQDPKYTVLDAELFKVGDFSIAKDNIEYHTGEEIDGVINSTSLQKIDKNKIKVKTYKQKQ